MLHTPFGRRLAALSPRTKLFLMIAADALFLPLCVLAAVALRLGSLEAAATLALPIQIGLGLSTLPVLAMAGLYRAVLRYIDVRVLMVASTALGIAVLLIYASALVLNMQVIPRSSLLIYWFIAFAYVTCSRFLARTLLRRSFNNSNVARQRTAIYGAGEAGTQLARAMQTSPEYEAVCFIDDKSSLQHRTVAGLRVYSPNDFTKVVSRYDVAQIVVAIPSSTPIRRRELISRVEHAGLPVKILPGLLDMVDGLASVSDIREVDVADLLGRDPVPPNPQLFARNLRGKVVLVSGAGGSIGSELCRQIISQKPRKLVLLDHAEYSLYAIDHELQHAATGCEVVAALGSVLDETMLYRLFTLHGVETVFHAAGYKHVPIVEGNVQQGLRNNVFGSLSIARAAAAAAVATCVLVSTDKAVRPTNVMGASKRIAELVFQAAALRGGSTVYSMVRFGNVLGSSGSVVPLFKRQIQAGGPITITHPDISRYFMLIPEAAQLVIQAGAMAQGGEVFVLDMGDPVRIADLARSMIHLSGLSERTATKEDGDIEIKFVGLRPGEKLFEELLIGDEVVGSDHARIMCARERHIDPALLDKMLASLRQACDSNDVESMLRQVRNLVPEFRPAEEVNAEAEAAAARVGR